MRTRFMHMSVNNNNTSNIKTVIKIIYIEKDNNHNDNNEGLFISFILISILILRNIDQ